MPSRASLRSTIHRSAIDLLPLLGIRGPKQRWNNGNLDIRTTRQRRCQVSVKAACSASAERVFDCLAEAPWSCWADPGAATVIARETPMIWSDVSTADRLFALRGVNTFWVMTRCDRSAKTLQFVLAQPKLAVGRIDVAVLEDPGTGCCIAFDFVETSLPRGASSPNELALERRMHEMLEAFADSFSGRSPDSSAVAPRELPGLRKRADVEQTVRADAAAVFALACPVAELAWIDDWQFDLVSSESGRNEVDCVFDEPFTGPMLLHSVGADTTWYTTLYDAERLSFTAVTMVGDRMLGVWEWQADSDPSGTTHARWGYSFTGISDSGNKAIGDPAFEHRLRGMLQFLAASLRSYAEDRKLLAFPWTRKVHLGLNGAATALRRARSPFVRGQGVCSPE